MRAISATDFGSCAAYGRSTRFEQYLLVVALCDCIERGCQQFFPFPLTFTFLKSQACCDLGEQATKTDGAAESGKEVEDTSYLEVISALVAEREGFMLALWRAGELCDCL
jgi:hypothetical protein